MKSTKTLRLPRSKDLKSNKLKDVQEHLQLLYDELDRTYRRQFDDIGRMEDGAEVGQMMYFNGIHWVPIDTSKLIWSNATGTIAITRLLVGGVRL